MTFAFAILIAVGLVYLMGKPSQFLSFRLDVTSVAHAVPVASGAYVYAIATSRMGCIPILAAAAGIVAAGMAGGVLILLSSRLSLGDYSLLSFALQLVFSSVVLNLRFITGGPLGMAGIPPVLTSSFVDNTTLHLGLVAVAGLIVCGFDMLLGDRPVATCYQILGRSNELGTTLGLPANRLRFSCGALQGLCLGVAGVLSASYYSIIEPRQFAVSLSVMILVVSYFRRSWRGATGAGAFMLVGLPEALRLVGWSSDRAAAMQLLLSGIVGMVFCFSSLRGQRL